MCRSTDTGTQKKCLVHNSHHADGAPLVFTWGTLETMKHTDPWYLAFDDISYSAATRNQVSVTLLVDRT